MEKWRVVKMSAMRRGLNSTNGNGEWECKTCNQVGMGWVDIMFCVAMPWEGRGEEGEGEYLLHKHGLVGFLVW